MIRFSNPAAAIVQIGEEIAARCARRAGRKPRIRSKFIRAGRNSRRLWLEAKRYEAALAGYARKS